MKIKKISGLLFFIIIYCLIYCEHEKNYVFAKELIAINFGDRERNLLGKPLEHDKNIEVVPCGLTIGVKINTDGIMVLGTGKIITQDGEIDTGKNLKPGDLIISANEKILTNKEELINIIENSEESLDLKIKRNEEFCDIKIKLAKSFDDGKNKIGAWVRDSTQGVGTMTYYNPYTNKFGALGHGITDIDTQKLLIVREGEIKLAENISVIKGESGNPGEILGDIKNGDKIGDIKLNNEFGLYGTIDFEKLKNNIPDEKLPIALKKEIHEGKAVIKSDIYNGIMHEYEIYIESINNFDSDDSKNMTIKIIDKDLLAQTNGIIQGMSGCPILQDNKLIGAVTHVFVKEPSRGYGIFIENMLKQEKLLDS